MKHSRLYAAVAAVVMLSACASNKSAVREIRGTVDQVNVGEKTLVLSSVENAPSNARTVTVYFENDTRVTYQQQTFTPQNLEKGDEISVMAESKGDRLVARSMSVLRNVRAAGGVINPDGTTAAAPEDRYANASRGTVRRIDHGTKLLEVDLGGLTAHIITVTYDSATRVEQDGQERSINDVKPGETIDINTRRSGERLFAESINLLRGAKETAVTTRRPGVTISDVSGTVRAVDRRGFIELEKVTWGRTFASETRPMVTIGFDERTQLEFRGRRGSPASLERGDIIDIQLRNNAEPYVAEKVWVVSDVRTRQ
jgi:hypothetical protein